MRRLLLAILRLAPWRFRRRYGSELLETMALRVDGTNGGHAARGLRALLEVAGLTATVIRLRINPGKYNPDPFPGPRRETQPPMHGLFSSARQDLRFALRSLARNPYFSLAALTVMTLGIGATTAIFSAVNSYFFRPLPFADAGRVVRIYETNPEFHWTDADAAPANVLDWRERVAAFDDVAAYSNFVAAATHVAAGEAELIKGSPVTGNFFSVLGIEPELGRTFRWDETWAGKNDVIVISHALWSSHFGADPGVVGRTIELNDTSLQIIGVAPAGFRFPSDATRFWFPMGWARESRSQTWFRRAHFVQPIARLAPGATMASADQQLQAAVAALQQEYPDTNRVMGAGMMPLRQFLTRAIRRPLMILMGSVALLLLLACVNVANLLLVRADGRGREVALRYALGAGRGRVVRLMATESLTLAAIGGGLGLALGWTVIRLMERFSDLGIDGATQLALDGRVVAFTVVAACSSGLLAGVLPSLRATRGGVEQALRDGGRGATSGHRAMRTTNALVAIEVALAVLLVVGAGLMIRSFWKLRNVDLGFRTEAVLALQFTVPKARYQNRDEVLGFYSRLSRALEARPEIDRVGLVGQLPLTGTSWSSQFQAEGWAAERVGLEILHRRADRGYFETLGIPLIRGRLFEPTDTPDGPPVVVINKTFASEFFPGEDPIGQRIAYDRAATSESTWYEIVGVVGDQQQVSPAIAARAEVFENAAQDWDRSIWIVVRARVDADATLQLARSVLAQLDPLIPLATARPLRQVWNQSMAQEKFILVLLVTFGAVALLLATVGVYTVAAQAARRRTHEIGIRIALGAAAADVRSLVLRRGLFVVGAGLAGGVVLVLVATRTLASQLYGVGPTDPLTLGAVLTLLGATAVAACYLPAHRAARLDPVQSLRSD